MCTNFASIFIFAESTSSVFILLDPGRKICEHLRKKNRCTTLRYTYIRVMIVRSNENCYIFYFLVPIDFLSDEFWSYSSGDSYMFRVEFTRSQYVYARIFLKIFRLRFPKIDRSEPRGRRRSRRRRPFPKVAHYVFCSEYGVRM